MGWHFVSEVYHGIDCDRRTHVNHHYKARHHDISQARRQRKWKPLGTSSLQRVVNVWTLLENKR